MYKWVVGKDSTIEFVGDRKKGGEKDPKSDKPGNESDGKPSRASRRKGRRPPLKTVKIEPPYPDESDSEMETTEDDYDTMEEREEITDECVGPSESTEKSGEEAETASSMSIKEEPLTEDEEAYGVMPTSVASSYDTNSDMNSVGGSQASTADMSDSACDLSTGGAHHKQPPSETANNVAAVPPTLPVANGLMPTLIQTGTPIFVAAVPSIAATVQAVDANNPLNLIASTAALAPKVAVNNKADKSNELRSDRLIASSKAAAIANRKRADKQAVPDNQKDGRYFERRRRNNLAAKRSRDARRAREEEMSDKIARLEAENAILRAQLSVMKERAESLRKNLDDSSSTPSS